MKCNVYDFLLENYYTNIYPKPLSTARITVPAHYSETNKPTQYTYLSLARHLTHDSTSDSDTLIQILQQHAIMRHTPSTPKGLSQFPLGNNETLSMYALRVFGDTHALDDDTNLRKELNQHLRNTFGDTDLTRMNIIPNDETLFAVWSKGVTLNEGFVGLTLTDTQRVPLRPLKAVWVFENRNTAQRILRLHPELTFPFIIASGQPNKTVLALLDRLHKQRTKILYHGDMDPAGLTIASTILNHVPIITPFMSVSEYNKQEKYPQLTSQPADIDPTFRPLLTLIQKNKQCVYEEQLDLNKCQIYYDLMV